MADPSLWTTRKDICDFIAIHPVPEHISKDDFAAKQAVLINALAKTDIAKKLVQIGLPRPREMVITHAVFRDAQDCKELLRHPSTKAIAEEAKLFGFGNDASLFTVDTLTRTLNTKDLASTETVIGVFKIPTGVPKQLFEEKVQVLLENAFKIPAVTDQVVHYTMWCQSSAVDFEVVQTLGMPAPASLLLCKAEAQLTGYTALLDRAEVQEVMKEHMVRRDLPLGLEGDFFVATKVVLFEKD
ncbi:hypothetical protein C8F01DRAFT_1295517 [Mycena amicta]|nr:hypothetical protein C8F01DRAFT_1295517 [Mycena amicta]